MRYWKFMGEYNAITDSYSEFAGTSGASPYNPDEDARLKGLRVIFARDSAASLVDAVVIKLTCTAFQPNSIEVGGDGGGIQTAPVAAPRVYDWEVDQPVKSNLKITLEGKKVGADTYVTPNVLLFGLFDNGQK